MDFYAIKERQGKNGLVEIFPDFKVVRSKDLMVRGKGFYAIWNDDTQMWSTDEYDVQKIVDKDLLEYRDRLQSQKGDPVKVKLMSDFSTNSWAEFRRYMSNISDSNHQLDSRVIFSNQETRKKDYASKKLSYPFAEGSIDAYEELVGTLYSPEERAKIEWAIGSIITGDSQTIQKFLVFFGEAGTGKSTILNIIQWLFEGYYTTFEAKALTSSNNSFSTEVFRTNPLVAIQHDGDLSRIEDNTKLNSIVSHEAMTMNEKYKPAYTSRANCMLFIATNKPVKITDGKSGLIRRLIDIHPTGNKIPNGRFQALVSQVKFELGAIAWYCVEVYKKMGKNYFSDYKPLDMMFRTDPFFNFVELHYFDFKESDGVSLSQGYDMYKAYCEDSASELRLPRHRFRDELRNYFKTFSDMTRVDGKQVRSYFSGFLHEKFMQGEPEKKTEEKPSWLDFEETSSRLDQERSGCKAQYANSSELPEKRWADVNTTLSNLDTKKTHYVQLQETDVTIDFDLKDLKGEKNLELNLKAASLWPPTYAELSKSGVAIHLHYSYAGDTSILSVEYSPGIEIKVQKGNAALRRKLTYCNKLPIAVLSESFLPKKEKKVIDHDIVLNEKALRTLVVRNLRKEIHPATRPSIDFINTLLDEAYAKGVRYDLTDLRPKVMVFAANSTHQSEYCLRIVAKMKFKSEDLEPIQKVSEKEIIYLDVEVFPNLFVVCWKLPGDSEPVCMINPTTSEIEPLFDYRIIGFNNRRYDNHILYARYIGYSIPELYRLSQKIIAGSPNSMFSEAWNLSYADVYDFSSKKQSLKKFQIDLGIHHQELGLPWDQEVPEELWLKVADYCKNDVASLEAVFQDRKDDYLARLILSDLSGLPVNSTTQTHAAKIIFGDDPNPQSKFVYTDLSTIFPGYTFTSGRSYYRGEEPGEGGYVYAEPGFYVDVGLDDVESMHPVSAELLNLFGEYTKKFSELKAARLAIKHKDYEAAKKMLNGTLAKYLTNPEESSSLAYALKIIINMVYGLTSASFDNKFRDKRNLDNIVAKRGALFMIDLKNYVQSLGHTVAHIKTDSIKVPNVTSDILKSIAEFGKKYGYTFAHEATYDRLCLINDAVYIARYKDGKHAGEWTATGAQFAEPYVFKTLFSHEEITLRDLAQTKSVSSFMYLDMNEGLPEDQHNYHFIGKVGLFCPVKTGKGGGVLLREKDGKYYAVTGTKGWRWLEAEVVESLDLYDTIDWAYYEELAVEAKAAIEKYVPFEKFVMKGD